VICRPEIALDARASAPGANDGEVPVPDVAAALRVEDDRDPRREERVARDQPPTAADLDDEQR